MKVNSKTVLLSQLFLFSTLLCSSLLCSPLLFSFLLYPMLLYYAFLFFTLDDSFSAFLNFPEHEVSHLIFFYQGDKRKVRTEEKHTL